MFRHFTFWFYLAEYTSDSVLDEQKNRETLSVGVWIFQKQIFNHTCRGNHERFRICDWQSSCQSVWKYWHPKVLFSLYPSKFSYKCNVSRAMLLELYEHPRNNAFMNNILRGPHIIPYSFILTRFSRDGSISFYWCSPLNQWAHCELIVTSLFPLFMNSRGADSKLTYKLTLSSQ